MFRRTLGFGAVLGGALHLAACGSSEESGGGVKDPEAPGRVAPADPGSPAAAGTEPTTLAVTSILLGDTNPDGTPNPKYWEKIGYNLDGLISTKDGRNHCKPLRGANPAFVKTDGDDGTDNSFGSNLMPIITSVAPDASPSLNASLQVGDFTVVIHMENADDSPTQSGISAALLGGSVHNTMDVCAGGGDAPCLDGTDEWPITFETLADGSKPPSVANAKVKFPSAYMVDGTWVSGSLGDLDLNVTIENVAFVLRIRNALITMDLTGRGADAEAVNGVIAGIIVTKQLIEDLRTVAGSLDESLCDGPTFDSIAQQVRAASDILSDGTNGDPDKACDAISVGLGFTATAIRLGPSAPPITPPDNPCPM